ncbi:B-box zinc finger protein 20-like isoform X2 [Silene latifolia]|uniref:B-box zinc finger protein 20-like isoform X2 n=1 Tax=Silene latifolia TaxID=37657 RepID=UPI003D781EC9
MKIQCDVCEKQEASVFCAADEAALCDGCDYRVHHANILASKHQRFPLLLPSFKDAPLCDICQERRAFLFCREDRAILCRECDIPIHKANEHTQSHSRFLLTGVRISASSAGYTNPSPLSTSSTEQNSETRNSVNAHSYDHDMPCNHSYYSSKNMSKTTSSTTNYNQITEDGSISTDNTLSEYLLESVPSWRFEDLLDDSYSPHYF